MTLEFQIGRQVGNFRILEEIGRGGMGIVYKAEQTSLQRVVAIKKIPRELARYQDVITRFKREALATAGLNHPGIVRIYDYLEVDGEPFYVMEFLDPAEWQSLRELIDGQVVFPPEDALRIMAKVLEALKAAHAGGLTHRDIKPANIMVSRDGEVKILDFGIAILAGQTRLTVDSNTTSGTVDYMSPEQGEGLELDQRCDIYAAGTILYEMLTGSLPYEAENAAVVLRLRAERDPVPISELNPEIPPDLEEVVGRALARNRDDRYPSAQQMITEIERYFRQQPFMAPLATRREPPAALSPKPGPSFVLEVNWEETRMRVGFTESGTSLQTVSHYEYVRPDPEEVEEWCRRVTEIIRKSTGSGGGSEAQLAELKRIGQAMYDSLLPLGVKNALARATASFLVFRLDDRAVKIPWELLFDGESFLCRRFLCGRIVSTFQEVCARPPRTVSAAGRFLIVSNPRGDLQASTDECVVLKRQLEHSPEIRIRMRNARASCSEVMEELRETDILHYSGHASYDPADSSKCGWLMTDGILGAADIRKLQGGQKPFPMLVFANACQSAVPELDDAEAEKRVFSVANAYLLAGVQNYVGTLGEVLDAHAAELALVFYKRVLHGASLGEALHAAREHIVDEFGEHRLIWAGYLMYGDPTRAVFPEKEEETSEPEAATAKQLGESEYAAVSRASVSGPPAGEGPRRIDAGPARARLAAVFVGIVLVLAVVGLLLHFGGLGGLDGGRGVESLAYAALREGRTGESRDLFLQLESTGRTAAAKTGLAAVALEQDRFEEAGRLSEQAIAEDPNATYARAVLGRVLISAPETAARGIEELRAALAGDLPYGWQRAETHLALGDALASQGEYAQAVEQVEAAAGAGDRSVETMRNLAGLYAKAGRDDDALETYEETLEKYPGDRWTEAGLAMLRNRLEFERDRAKQEQVRNLLDGFRTGEAGVTETNTDRWTSRILGVAVLPPRQVGGPVVRNDEDEYFAYFLMRELAGSPRVKVVDRDLLDAILTELRLSRDGLAEAGNSVRVGEILSARVVVAPTLFHLPGKVRADVRLIDVETTRVIAQPQADSTKGVDSAVSPIAAQILEAIRTAYPVHGRVTSVSGETGIGLNVGSAHGVRDGMVLEVLEEEAEDAPSVGTIEVTRANPESSLAVVRKADREITPDLPVREARDTE